MTVTVHLRISATTCAQVLCLAARPHQRLALLYHFQVTQQRQALLRKDLATATQTMHTQNLHLAQPISQLLPLRDPKNLPDRHFPPMLPANLISRRLV